jgi:nucleotide-binding universal stress UspA family protein
MEAPLVVGVDGSGSSLVAVDWATDEAVRHRLPLRLVYASGREPDEGAVAATATQRARRRNPQVQVTADVVPEDAVDALLREAGHATAVVTGSRGCGELKGLLLGSVSLAVAGRAPGPVVVVRGDKAGLEGAHERILLGAGEPGSCGAAVRFALREAEVRHCVLDVVRVWRRPRHEPMDHPLAAGDPAHFYEERAATLIDALLQDAVADHPDVRVNRSTVEGTARKVLLHRSAAADLVIIGVRRGHGHWALHPGRVEHALLHRSECPVAVVPEVR